MAKDNGPENTAGAAPGTDFIRAIIKEDLASGKHGGKVHTRFPPEPNGYLHIGHAKSICLNFGIGADYAGGLCNLRFDDTNPSKEDQEYIDSIIEDVRWLGFDWEDRCYYASDYFEQLYTYAEKLIEKGLAYVCDLNAEEVRAYRGTLTEPGKDSPYRNRSVAENLDLFRRMRAGEFPDGARTLRAKIDMASANLNMRDPVLYRILRATHHRTGDTWCIYPMYDYAHPVSDSIEGITYSICTLEFEDHRPLYDWFLEKLGIFPSRQIEFARLNLSYTVMSKRKLLQLVQEKTVSGWDDPRMPTIAGIRSRGVTPEAVRDFCERIGVAKKDSMVDVALFEHCVREDLNASAPRVMAVLRPLKVVIENYPEDKAEEFDISYHPDKPEMGLRQVPFSRELYIEQDDFMEDPPAKYFRLAPGREVRLRGAYFITCTGVTKDAKTGAITELRCTYDQQTRGGDAPDGRKVKATLHWVSARHAVKAKVRLYDRLFTAENPFAEAEKAGLDSFAFLNKDSLITLEGCALEASLKDAQAGSRYQFERLGYFFVDPKDSRTGSPVFNRTVTLKDTYAKIEKREPRSASHSSGTIVGRVVGDSEYSKSTPASPPPSLRGDISNAKQSKQAKASPPEITIDDFARLDLRVGIIREAALVEGADKLIKMQIDVGEGRTRQIFAGIKPAFPDPAALIGVSVIVVANLKPRQMKFGLSEGMLLAASGIGGLSLCTLAGKPEPGDKIS